MSNLIFPLDLFLPNQNVSSQQLNNLTTLISNIVSSLVPIKNQAWIIGDEANVFKITQNATTFDVEFLSGRDFNNNMCFIGNSVDNKNALTLPNTTISPLDSQQINYTGLLLSNSYHWWAIPSSTTITGTTTYKFNIIIQSSMIAPPSGGILIASSVAGTSYPQFFNSNIKALTTLEQSADNKGVTFINYPRTKLSGDNIATIAEIHNLDIGQIVTYPSGITPRNGLLPLSGGTFSQLTYPLFTDWLKNAGSALVSRLLGNAIINGTSTFTLPNYNNNSYTAISRPANEQLIIGGNVTKVTILKQVDMTAGNLIQLTNVDMFNGVTITNTASIFSLTLVNNVINLATDLPSDIIDAINANPNIFFLRLSEVAIEGKAVTKDLNLYTITRISQTNVVDNNNNSVSRGQAITAITLNNTTAIINLKLSGIYRFTIFSTNLNIGLYPSETGSIRSIGFPSQTRPITGNRIVVRGTNSTASFEPLTDIAQSNFGISSAGLRTVILPDVHQQNDITIANNFAGNVDNPTLAILQNGRHARPKGFPVDYYIKCDYLV